MPLTLVEGTGNSESLGHHPLEDLRWVSNQESTRVTNDSSHGLEPGEPSATQPISAHITVPSEVGTVPASSPAGLGTKSPRSNSGQDKMCQGG